MRDSASGTQGAGGCVGPCVSGLALIQCPGRTHPGPPLLWGCRPEVQSLVGRGGSPALSVAWLLAAQEPTMGIQEPGKNLHVSGYAQAWGTQRALP